MRRTMWAITLLAIAPGVAAQVDSYPRPASMSAFLMDRADEIALARSAAPESIAREATVLVLGADGYTTGVEGTNGFVCLVARGWLAAFDWAEYWNARVRAADCLNPAAASFLVPLFKLRSELVMRGSSREEVLAAVRNGYASGALPTLEQGAIEYMMSPVAYLTDTGGNQPHLMFLTSSDDAGSWGANLEKSPVMAAPYWFFFSDDPALLKGLPQVMVVLVAVPTWSDGSADETEN